MSLDLYSNYLSRTKGTSKDNEDYYRTYAQEWMNKYFYDSTLVRKIKEEKYPFNKEYIDYDIETQEKRVKQAEKELKSAKELLERKKEYAKMSYYHNLCFF